jgi:hypothetical protein
LRGAFADFAPPAAPASFFFDGARFLAVVAFGV